MIENKMDNNVELDFLLPFLNTGGNLKILDVGCGVELNLLLEIYNLIPNKIAKLTGVDILKDKDDGEELSFVSVPNINKLELIPEDGFSYLKSLKTYQDLIIFSNFLHLYSWEMSKGLIQIALTKLTSKGIIYIKVRNKNKPFYKYPYDAKNIEEIKSFAKILFFEEKGMHFNLIIKNLETI